MYVELPFRNRGQTLESINGYVSQNRTGKENSSKWEVMT
jgi:hypothetical protein